MIDLKKLKRLFANSSLSIANIAAKAKIGYSTLTRLLNGSTINPRIETVQSLALYFGVPVSDLYDYELDNELNILANKTIKDVLSYLLLQSGLINTAELSKSSNIPKSNLDRILNGTTEKPNIHTVTQLANYFNISTPQMTGLEPLNNHKTSTSSNNKINISVPVCSLAEIKTYSNKLNNSNQLVACVIDHEQLEPDFSKGTTLIIDISREPKIMQFIIAEIQDKIIACEFYKATDDAVFAREAGSSNILEYPKQHFKVLGTVSQEIINYT